METTTATAAQTATGPRPTLPPLQEIRGQFPLLAREQDGKPLAYLDNGATSQKPLAVIEALDRYWREQNANVHRGVYRLSEEATTLYERARKTVARHLAAEPHEVIFTRNVTGSLNLVAHAWGRANVGAGDRIVLTEMEHHSNIVPWYLLAREVGAKLEWVPIDGGGRLDMDALAAAMERSPKLVGVAHVSNVLGTINPVAEIVRMAHEAGAIVVVDGAQAAPKLQLDMPELGADFYGFTGHKLYGPTGVGVLYGRRELLEAMEPFEGGGSMIRKVTKERISWASVPARFEAGTPPIGEAIALAAAIEWLDAIGLDAAHAHEAEVAAYALERLAEVPGLRIFGPPAGDDRVGIVSFDVEGVHAHDVSEILDRHAVCVRAGHHCAQILMERLGVPATTRASLAVYNTREEIDRLVEALHDVRRVFELD